eukprot:RCo027521
MAMYSPMLHPSSIPPANYPPRWSWARGGLGGAVFLGLGLLLGGLEGRQPVRRKPPVTSRQPFTEVLPMVALVALGYLYVSGALLRRSNPFHSRYLSCWEFLKLLGVTLIADALLLRHGRGSVSWVVYCAAVFLGLHVVQADHIAVLRSLGGKVVH